MKRLFLFLFPLLIGAVLSILIINNVGWEKIGLAFKNFSLKTGLIILCLTILAVLVRSWRWKTILKSQGYNIPALRILEYYLSGNSISFFIPMIILGGEVLRGYNLKEKYAMPWSKSIASVMIDRILEITIYFLTAILGIIFFLLNASLPSGKISVIIFSAIFLVIVLFSVFYFRSFRKERLVPYFLKKFNLQNSNGAETAIDTEKEIFRYFRLNKKAVWQGFGLSVLVELILLGRTVLLMLFLGKNIGFLLAIAIAGFSSLALTLPLPAALGSHEAVQSFIFNALGLGANTAMAFVFIIRGAELFLALIGAVFFFKFGVQVVESTIINKIKKIAIRKPKNNA